MRGRPRKPTALREQEGNRSRRAIPPDMPLEGLPTLPDWLAGDKARDHFRFVAAEFQLILKRADSPAVAKLAMAWEFIVKAFEAGDVDAFCKASGAWDRQASRLGIQVVDRAKLMSLVPAKPDASPLRKKYGVVG